MKKHLTAFVAILALAFSAALALAHGYKLGNLEIKHPNSMAMMQGAEVAGGFLIITNNGTEADRLIKVESDFAPMIQLHEMKVENDVMTMAEVPGGIEIPAGGTVELKKGGLHVMFMKVPKPSKEGDKIKAILTFEKAGSIEVVFNVGPAHGAAADHKQHAGMTDMEQPADPMHAIPMVMKALFETHGNPLSVEPIVVEGDFAIASWSQAGKGGRALLKKGEKGWSIHLCSGASLKDANALHHMGMSKEAAKAAAAALAKAETSLGAEKIAQFDSFEGTMMVGEEGHSAQ